LTSGQEVGMAKPEQIKSKNDARQGVTGHGVRYVLGVSLALVVVGFIVAYVVVQP
jgi:hypothetical protein